MKWINKAAILAAMLALTACTTFPDSVVALNNAQAVGSPFTKFLAVEYRTYANALLQDYARRSEAEHFAAKGLAAVNGEIVMPEAVVDGWFLKDKDLTDILHARTVLIDALDKGGRDRMPEKAAVAQVRFDCWVKEQNSFLKLGGFCKYMFWDTIKQMEAGITPPAAVPVMPPAFQPPAAAVESVDEFPAPIGSAGGKGDVAPLQQAMFIVFFDWNKHDLNRSANDVLDAIAQELNTRRDIRQITIVGHADTSGGAAYNTKISLKRAKAVETALVARGVSPSKLKTEGRGESELLVRTGDNVREPGNRRAQITLE